MLLMEHLSHLANMDMTLTLAQRAHTALQQRHQAPLPINAALSPCDPQQQQQQQFRSSSATAQQGTCADPDAVQRLRSLCASVWDSSTCVRLGASAGGGSSSSSAGSAADAAAGLASGTLRLLKLLCLPVLDAGRLSVGGMMNKGAFSEVMAGKVSDLDEFEMLPLNASAALTLALG
jgi:hypothetical protein